MKVWYLCDGERPECTKRTCYKNGGICKHTSDIEHAINFKKEKTWGDVTYKENQRPRNDDAAIWREVNTLNQNMQNSTISLNSKYFRDSQKFWHTVLMERIKEAKSEILTSQRKTAALCVSVAVAINIVCLYFWSKRRAF